MTRTLPSVALRMPFVVFSEAPSTSPIKSDGFLTTTSPCSEPEFCAVELELAFTVGEQIEVAQHSPVQLSRRGLSGSL